MITTLEFIAVALTGFIIGWLSNTLTMTGASLPGVFKCTRCGMFTTFTPPNVCARCQSTKIETE